MDFRDGTKTFRSCSPAVECQVLPASRGVLSLAHDKPGIRTYSAAAIAKINIAIFMGAPQSMATSRST